ncbi:MAG TPA: hypothetical protein VFC03_06240, partial [Acidimicrobiales bacterium]|nr:hypothetical protein [Acidimicrobiales bacterium]
MRSRRDRIRRLAPTVVLIPAIAAITLSTGVGASGADSTPLSWNASLPRIASTYGSGNFGRWIVDRFGLPS